MKTLWQWTEDVREIANQPLPGAHDRLAQLTQHLVRATGDLVGDVLAQEELAQFGGAQHMAAVVAARQGLAGASVEDLTLKMKASVEGQLASGKVDEGSLIKELEELQALTGDLERAVMEFVSSAKDRAHREQMEALTMAARQVPGASLRVTEEVVGPDGSATTVRDELITGPTDDSPQVIDPATPAEIKHALGLDVGRTQEAADRVGSLRGRRALRRLGLPESASFKTVQHELRRWLLDGVKRDDEIAGVLPFLPDGLQDVQPGDLHTLRSNLAQGMLNGFDQVSSRASRGDRKMASAQMMVLTGAFAVTSAVPYHLPLDELPDDAAVDRWRLPNEETLVLHDQPVEAAGIPAVAWLFTAADDGVVEEVGQVLVAEGGLTFAVRNVNLAQGPAAPTARRVLSALTANSWSVPKKRKLPGAPGDKAWTAQLARHAHQERRTGSLARVRTLIDRGDA